MKKHIIWMIIGCGLPLLLLFLAPAIGLRNDIAIFIFIIAMFACHLLMPMHHSEGHNLDGAEKKKYSKTNKTKIHEQHN